MIPPEKLSGWPVVPSRLSALCLLLLALGSLLLANTLRVKTGAYSFRRVADTTGDFEAFFPAPALNDAGTLVFAARLKTGPEGIFARKSAWWYSLVTLADTRADWGHFGFLPSINEAGLVLFSAGYKRGGTCAATVPIQGKPITTVAITSGPSRMTTLGMPSLNRTGQVAFFQMQDDGKQGIFVGGAQPGTPVRVADNQGPFHTFGLRPCLNEGGTLVFLARLKQGGWGLYRAQRPGDQPALLLAAGTKGFVGLSDPVSNASGTVIFRGSGVDGNEGIYQLAQAGGEPTLLADQRSNGYRDFSGWAVNEEGRVAFGATTRDGRPGIYTGPDPLKDRVIAAGDPLFRSRALGVFVAGRGLNKWGEVAFSYRLEDERSGVAVASPIRWSGATTFLLFCSAGLLGWSLYTLVRRG